MSEITNDHLNNPGNNYPTLVYQKPPMEKNQLGMIVFISSEAIFFALLILAYIFYQGQIAPKSDPNWPTAKNSLEAGKTLFFTFFLLASSGTIWFSERAIHAGKQRTGLIWLVVTIVFGAIFLVGQIMEYATLLGDKNVSISRNLFGTTFFTMTGFHGLHVFIGLFALSIVAFMMLVRQIQGNNSIALNTISVYWHFVDVVWVIIFSLVYLPVLLS